MARSLVVFMIPKLTVQRYDNYIQLGSVKIVEDPEITMRIINKKEDGYWHIRPDLYRKLRNAKTQKELIDAFTEVWVV